jgi:hypothetical protein
MDRLNVFRMIVSPRSSHTAGINMVGHHVRVFSEFSVADSAFAALGDDLSVQQLPHLRIGADFSVSSRVSRIVNSTDSHLAR